MKTILVGAAAFGCVTGPSGAGENGNPSLDGSVLKLERLVMADGKELVRQLASSPWLKVAF